MTGIAEKTASLILSVILLTYAAPLSCAVTHKCEAADASMGVRTDANDGAVFSWHRNSSSKIALTFDDGPHPRHTREILDILEEYGVTATFFVIGVNAEAYPEIVKAEIDRGHEVGNHTYSHANLRRECTAEIVRELDDAEKVIYEAAEYKPKLLRPPGGKYANQLKEIAKQYNYSIILWTVDTKDWAHKSVDSICDNVLTNVKSGDIILFHDHITGGSPTPEALRRIIPELKSRGFTFVTVSELIGSD